MTPEGALRQLHPSRMVLARRSQYSRRVSLEKRQRKHNGINPATVKRDRWLAYSVTAFPAEFVPSLPVTNRASVGFRRFCPSSWRLELDLAATSPLRLSRTQTRRLTRAAKTTDAVRC